MKRYTFIFPLVCAVALLTSCEKKSAVTYEYTIVTRGSVQNTVSAVGTLSATATVSVQGSASGIVDAIFVQAGDGVQRGQKIADINTTGNPNQRQLSAVYSPIDGVVSDIPLGIGGAVLGRGSPAATTLFTLTSHTDTLVINAPVGELDIGSLSVGQEAKITLQSAPGKTYTSKVSRILPLATTTDNVVTYTVQCEIANKDGSLRPGMTASIQFILQKESDVLTVPNAALRFTPETAEKREDAKPAANAVTNALTGGKASSTGGNPFGHPTGSQSFFDGEKEEKSAPQSAKTHKTLWYTDENGKLASVAVMAGISDGVKTVVSKTGEGVELEGLKVILRQGE